MKSSTRAFPIKRMLATLLFAALLLAEVGSGAAEFDHSHAAYDALLRQFVADGRVNYRGLQTDLSGLMHYLDSLAGISEAAFHAWSEPEQLAFLINLYNATTLKLVVDHYPLHGIKNIGSMFKGPWDQPVVRLLGKTITLNNLEHDIIRKKYHEPRIHMALVCAAKGCPPLRSEAYTPGRLDAQLDDQCRRYLTSLTGLLIDRGQKVVYLSAIFKWYGKDFVERFTPADGFPDLDQIERAVAHFCSRYLVDADRDFLKSGGYSIKYLDYDWSLNEK